MPDPPTHFFNFIPPGFLFNLSIPTSFLTNLTDKRFLKAILRRGRHEWSVDVDDGVFGDGWRRFVTETGVQELDFIVFKHQGSMVFDFLVFDQSTCEKQSSVFYENDGQEPLTQPETIRPKNLKKRKWNDYASQEEETCQVGDRTDCFVSKMAPYVINRSRLYIPMKFARLNGLITKRLHTQVYLMNDTQRTWPATLTKRKNDICYITGWRDFRVENNLKVGDVCMFELLKHGQVPVFKCYNLKSKPNSSSKEAESGQKEGSVLCENGISYFVGVLKSCNIGQSFLYLPKPFARSNRLLDNRKMVLIHAEDKRSWTVEFKNCKNRWYYIGRGWDDFRVAYGLKKGDHFKLEVVNKGKKPIVYFYLQKIH